MFKTVEKRTLHLTPKGIANKMDEYIIGQNEAKKAVSIAFVNRNRRMMIEDEDLRAEILPKNVLLFGPTGVGKTEIARRVADITDSPFIKVEMTKFTEVGYAGKDVECIIRDLVDLTVKREKDKIIKQCEIIASEMAIAYVMHAIKEMKVKSNKDILQTIKSEDEKFTKNTQNSNTSQIDDNQDIFQNITEDMLISGKYDSMDIFIEIPRSIGDKKDVFNNLEYGLAGSIGNATTMISIIPLFKGKENNGNLIEKMKVRDALELMNSYYMDKYVSERLAISDILKKIEQKGVVFLDEIDKLISNKESQSRGEVSREGVQRDLLPIIEGTVVQTKYGSVKTDHILFIAAGAFYYNKVNDLMPELQGRFPVSVKLKPLTIEDFKYILTKLKYNLLEQQQKLLQVDGIDIKFTKDGINAIAEIANRMNSELENIGARRLFSIIEKVVEEVSFSGKKGTKLTINKKYVEKTIKDEFDKKIDTKKYTI